MSNKVFYIFLAVVVIFAVTNPSLEDHKSKVKQMVIQSIGTTPTEGLGSVLAFTFMDKLVDGMISRDNYILFSITKGNVEGQENNIGIGALGYVHLYRNLKDMQQNEDEVQHRTEEIIEEYTK